MPVQQTVQKPPAAVPKQVLSAVTAIQKPSLTPLQQKFDPTVEPDWTPNPVAYPNKPKKADARPPPKKSAKS